MSNPLMGHPRIVPVDPVETYIMVEQDHGNPEVWTTVERCELEERAEPFGMNYPTWETAVEAARRQRPLHTKVVVRF